MNNDFYFFTNLNFNVEHKNDLTLLKQKQNNSTVKIAKKIEGLFLYMMLKSMRNSCPKDTLIDKNQEHIYEDIYDQFITQKMSETGLGLAKIIEKQIQQLHETIPN
ncbi:MAG: rod-binding protein [Buchnera aphidicola (Meitanaphis flavogallis)]